MEDKNKKLTESYSTWGSKILQHADVLNSIQNEKFFKPITVQLAPVEACDSDCPFCSVAGRPLKNRMSFDQINQVLNDFRTLGAKSVEITGGGNPMLWRHKGKNINDIIDVAYRLGYEIGIITNSNDFRFLNPDSYKKIKWVRVSLIKLDEGKKPEDYNFREFPQEKLGFSYIIYEGSEHPDPLSRTGKAYSGTTVETVKGMIRIVEMHPKAKFVRIAGNCLIKGNNESIKDQFKDVVSMVNSQENFFLKDIGTNDSPFKEGCYVGAIRPYVASCPDGEGYYVYACTSHVLQKRNYDKKYALCEIKDIMKTWYEFSENYKKYGYPYQIKENCGKQWDQTCTFCYYYNNNKILHTVSQELPDKNFA